MRESSSFLLLCCAGFLPRGTRHGVKWIRGTCGWEEEEPVAGGGLQTRGLSGGAFSALEREARCLISE